MSPEFRECPSYFRLGKRYLISFNSFAGKDSPRLVKTTPDTRSVFSFLQPELSTLSLATWEAPTTGQQKTPDESTSANDTELQEDYTEILRAARIIQRMWASRYQILQGRRKFFSSAPGQAIVHIQKICHAVVDSALLERGERLRLRGVLFSAGLELHIFAERIDRMYKETRDNIKATIDKADIKQLESAQVQWESLSTIAKTIAKYTGFMSEINWHKFQVPADELERRFRAISLALQHTEFKLSMLNTKERIPTAAVAIQRMWRAQRQILKQRREFRRTPSGEAIAYVQRIVNAIDEREPLERQGRIERASLLFGNVVKLIVEVKRIEKLYQETKRAVKSRTNGARGAQKQTAQAEGVKIGTIRDMVRRDAAFLAEENWIQLNIPAHELTRKCQIAWWSLEYAEEQLWEYQ